MSKYAALIVDDNEQDRYLLKRQLKETNLDIKIFEKGDGKDAIEFLKDYNRNRIQFPDEFPPSLVFLDINMPLVNGFEFLDQFSEIRQSVEVEAVVIMMFTSSEREEDKQKAFSHDFVKGYLLKGEFTSEQLKDRIEALL